MAEDHWYQSGLGDAVLEALADAHSSARIRRLAVEAMPTSGGPEELLRWAGIDAPSIAAAAQDLLKSGTEHGRVRAEFPVS